MEERDPDWELYRQAMNDSCAFDRLRQKYRSLVRGALRKLKPDLQETDLQDLEQNVWIAVYGSLPTFRGESLFSTWLVGCCRNIFLNWLRRQQRDDENEGRGSDAHTAQSAEEACLDAAAMKELLEKILNEKELQVILLRYYEELTDVEIARRLNIPLGTVKSLFRSALRKLRDDPDFGKTFGEELLKKILNEKEREVIRLRYYELLTDVEIAQRMNLSLETVKSLFRSALRKLRDDPDFRKTFGEDDEEKGDKKNDKNEGDEDDEDDDQ